MKKIMLFVNDRTEAAQFPQFFQIPSAGQAVYRTHAYRS